MSFIRIVNRIKFCNIVACNRNVGNFRSVSCKYTSSSCLINRLLMHQKTFWQPLLMFTMHRKIYVLFKPFKIITLLLSA